MTTTRTGRLPSPRTALLAVGALGLVGSLSATLAAWQDTEEITGSVTTSDFTIETDSHSFDASDLDTKGGTHSETYTLSNTSSSLPAEVTLDAGGFGGPATAAGALELTVEVDGSTVFDGDPRFGIDDLDLGGEVGALTPLTIDADDSVDVTITLSLGVDEDDADRWVDGAKELNLTPTFTFNAEQAS